MEAVQTIEWKVGLLTEFKAEELLDAHGISAEKLTAEIIDALKWELAIIGGKG